ncbi:hypothetical protein VNO80_16558 [Phaseolus coccineus]|uniref:Acylamino-acid-releasing enzyme N-terminal domain-containing protein n=1 Tax=Phaseolus coccineus TaxID=3886 RepID=A0AAN9R424_PHACN
MNKFSTSLDRKFLVFVSARSSVDSGAHSATDSLRRIDWPKDMKLYQSSKIHDVIPVVLFAEDAASQGFTVQISSVIHGFPMATVYVA